MKSVLALNSHIGCKKLNTVGSTVSTGPTLQIRHHFSYPLIRPLKFFDHGVDLKLIIITPSLVRIQARQACFPAMINRSKSARVHVSESVSTTNKWSKWQQMVMSKWNILTSKRSQLIQMKKRFRLIPLHRRLHQIISLERAKISRWGFLQRSFYSCLQY